MTTRVSATHPTRSACDRRSIAPNYSSRVRRANKRPFLDRGTFTRQCYRIRNGYFGDRACVSYCAEVVCSCVVKVKVAGVKPGELTIRLIVPGTRVD